MKAIQALRTAGNLEEALEKARELLRSKPDDIWSKRAISWVYYDYVKRHNQPSELRNFLVYLGEINKLALSAEEKMLFDQLSWQLGKMAFSLLKEKGVGPDQFTSLFSLFKDFGFSKPSEGYSFLLKAFHKAFKNSPTYLEFIDWWGLINFLPGDYQKEKLPDGREIMALAEQVYIAYAKQLLSSLEDGSDVWVEKTTCFLVLLDSLIQEYPQYQYPPYFKAKLLLALGDHTKMLEALLPFARRKQQVFWVWDLLGEAFAGEEDKVLACYCKALSCKSPEEMLIGVRQRMAALLVQKGCYVEANREIRLLVKAREAKGYNLPRQVRGWMDQQWFEEGVGEKDNRSFYQKYWAEAEQLLYGDLPEETVMVVSVRPDKEHLEFIASESCFGFFSYTGLLKKPSEGQVLKVRFQPGSKGARYKALTVHPFEDPDFAGKWLREVEGELRIQPGKPFGFVKEVYVHPSLVLKKKLSNGMKVVGKAVKVYQTDKEKWGWKLLDIR